MTADTFFELPDDGRRYELIDGVLELAPAPRVDVHQHTVRELFLTVHSHVREHRLGTVWFAPADVVLSAYDVVQPDLFYIRAARGEIIGGRIYGAPDLVVEVASPSTVKFDRGLKQRRYARFGVTWYWIVDPIERSVDELELVEGLYVRRAHLQGNVLFQPLLFPGLAIDFGPIWPTDIADAAEDGE